MCCNLHMILTIIVVSKIPRKISSYLSRGGLLIKLPKTIKDNEWVGNHNEIITQKLSNCCWNFKFTKNAIFLMLRMKKPIYRWLLRIDAKKDEKFECKSFL